MTGLLYLARPFPRTPNQLSLAIMANSSVKIQIFLLLFTLQDDRKCADRPITLSTPASSHAKSADNNFKAHYA